jgi:hypothetical protein
MQRICYPGPVTDPSGLFDRDVGLGVVLDHLDNGATVILGGRKMGKTSLLNVVASKAEETGGFAVVRLPQATSRAGLMIEILDGITRWLTAHKVTVDLTDDDSAQRSIIQFGKRIETLTDAAPGFVFVLCIDDFDNVINRTDEHMAGQIYDLLEYLDARYELPVRLLLTMSDVPEKSLNAYRSPLFNQARIVPIDPWPADRAAAFTNWLVGDDLIFDQATHTGLFAATGGHPYFIKAVVDALLSSRPAAPLRVTSANLTAAVRQAAQSHEVNSTLTNLVRPHLSPLSVALLDRVGKEANGVTARTLANLSVPGQLVHLLTFNGILGMKSRRYWLRLGLWREWRRARPSIAHAVRRPEWWLRLGGSLGELAHRRATTYTLLAAAAVSALLVGLATVYLFPVETFTAKLCDGSPLSLSATYPLYVSSGDEQTFRLAVVNEGIGNSPDGTVVVDVLDDNITIDSSNYIQFSGLGPREQTTQDIAFTTTASASWFRQHAQTIPVDLRINVDGRPCEPQRLSMAVAPIPFLGRLQTIAIWMLGAFLLPIIIEYPLFLRRRHLAEAGHALSDRSTAE